eukprot:352274-Chlamydomonas_euryale.AAC.2
MAWCSFGQLRWLIGSAGRATAGEGRGGAWMRGQKGATAECGRGCQTAGGTVTLWAGLSDCGWDCQAVGGAARLWAVLPDCKARVAGWAAGDLGAKVRDRARVLRRLAANLSSPTSPCSCQHTTLQTFPTPLRHLPRSPAAAASARASSFNSA